VYALFDNIPGQLSKKEKTKAIAKKVSIPAIGMAVSVTSLYVSDKLNKIDFKRTLGNTVSSKSADLVRAFETNTSEIYRRVLDTAHNEGSTKSLESEEPHIFHIEELDRDVKLTDLQYITIKYKIMTDFLDIFLYGAGMIHDHDGLCDVITLQDYAMYFNVDNQIDDYEKYSDVHGWSVDVCGNGNGYIQFTEEVSEENPNVTNVRCVWAPDFLEHMAPVDYERR